MERVRVILESGASASPLDEEDRSAVAALLGRLEALRAAVPALAGAVAPGEALAELAERGGVAASAPVIAGVAAGGVVAAGVTRGVASGGAPGKVPGGRPRLSWCVR